MRVVFDTNVLVAALRSRLGASFQLLSMIPTKQFQLALSLPLYLEYKEVLYRPNIRPTGISDADILDFTENILSHSETRDIHYLWRPSLPDQDDEMILELAVASASEYIVTFNVKDFINLELFGIQAVTPSQFLRFLKEK